MKEKIVVLGGGVAGINFVTKLVDNGYPGHLITVIDKGKDPYNRQPHELMSGFLGCGGYSDGKLTYHTSIGGQLSKYCGEDKAYELMDEVINNFKRFHPKPEEIRLSNPTKEPDFIKPYFNLRLFPVYHIGTDYLHEIGKNWYEYLISKEVNFKWECCVSFIEFGDWRDIKKVTYENYNKVDDWNDCIFESIEYDKLIIALDKAGIDLLNQYINLKKLKTESKSVQLGVRFEAPQHHFQKLIDTSYDFKLYRKFEDEGVSLRSFCVNNYSAYVAVEETYGDITYNGHAKKDPKFTNNMTNFGIIMEIQGIENPFEWSRKIIEKCQSKVWISKFENKFIKTGLFYSPNGTRQPSYTAEGNQIKVNEAYNDNLEIFKEAYGKYSKYILDFIEDLKKIFPTLKDDWGMYIPEVKYTTPELIVDYENLSLIDYPYIYCCGDSLSGRGITVSGAQGIYITKSLIS